MENSCILPAVIGVGIYDSSLYRQRGETDRRVTAFYELEFTLEAGGVLHIDGADHKIAPGLFVISKPGMTRWCGVPYRCAYIHVAPIDCGICRELDTFPVAMKLSALSEMERIFSELIKAAGEDPQPHGVALSPERGDFMIFAKLFEVIALLRKEPVGASVSRKLPPEVARAMEMIDASPGRIYTLAEFSAMLHLNGVYFERLFKKSVGKTPFRYMMDKKITIAKHLLLTTGKTSGEIGNLLGFSSDSHFSSTFRREVGMTPYEFRKNF